VRYAFLGLSAILACPALAQNVPAATSPDAAYRTSLWGTVIPVGLGATILIAQGGGEHDRTGPGMLLWGGSLFGPALGYTRAGLVGRGWRGVGLRAGLELATVTAAFAVCGMQCTNDQEGAADLVLIGGFSLVAVSAVYDIAHVRGNVRRHARSQPLTLAPFYAPSRRIGLRGSISF